MTNKRFTSPARLTDSELLARVRSLTLEECEVTATLVAHLAELDARRLFLAEGCSSLFTYCVEVLHLSEHAAYGRIEAARAARRFPVILDLLAEGALHLTAVCLLGPILTGENHRDVLRRARHRTKRQLEELVAELRPLPPVKEMVRRIPERRTSVVVEEPCLLAMAAVEDPLPPVEWPGPEYHGVRCSKDARPTSVVKPLSSQDYKVQFTANCETVEKLRRVKELLGHQMSDADTAAVVDFALTVALEKLEKAKAAKTERARSTAEEPAEETGPKPNSRHIPAAVRREVWARDRGRCAFVAGNGRRCSERQGVEFHHLKPYALDGRATVDNIELRCRAHNRFEAELCFGLSWMTSNSVRTELMQRPG